MSETKEILALRGSKALRESLRGPLEELAKSTGFTPSSLAVNLGVALIMAEIAAAESNEAENLRQRALDMLERQTPAPIRAARH